MSFPTYEELEALRGQHHKLGFGFMASWATRYFSINMPMLADGKLCIEYRESANQPAKGSIPLENIQKVEKYDLAAEGVKAAPSAGKLGWRCDARHPNRDYILCATNEADQQSWVNALQRCLAHPMSSSPSWNGRGIVKKVVAAPPAPVQVQVQVQAQKPAASVVFDPFGGLLQATTQAMTNAAVAFNAAVQGSPQQQQKHPPAQQPPQQQYQQQPQQYQQPPQQQYQQPPQQQYQQPPQQQYQQPPQQQYQQPPQQQPPAPQYHSPPPAPAHSQSHPSAGGVDDLVKEIHGAFDGDRVQILERRIASFPKLSSHDCGRIIEAFPFAETRVKGVAALAHRYPFFSVEDLQEILKAVKFSSEREDVLKAICPHVGTRSGWDVERVVAVLSFDSERTLARDLLRPYAQAAFVAAPAPTPAFTVTVNPGFSTGNIDALIGELSSAFDGERESILINRLPSFQSLSPHDCGRIVGAFPFAGTRTKAVEALARHYTYFSVEDLQEILKAVTFSSEREDVLRAICPHVFSRGGWDAERVVSVLTFESEKTLARQLLGGGGPVQPHHAPHHASHTSEVHSNVHVTVDPYMAAQAAAATAQLAGNMMGVAFNAAAGAPPVSVTVHSHSHSPHVNVSHSHSHSPHGEVHMTVDPYFAAQAAAATMQMAGNMMGAVAYTSPHVVVNTTTHTHQNPAPAFAPPPAHGIEKLLAELNSAFDGERENILVRHLPTLPHLSSSDCGKIVGAFPFAGTRTKAVEAMARHYTYFSVEDLQEILKAVNFSSEREDVLRAVCPHVYNRSGWDVERVVSVLTFQSEKDLARELMRGGWGGAPQQSHGFGQPPPPPAHGMNQGAGGFFGGMQFDMNTSSGPSHHHSSGNVGGMSYSVTATGDPALVNQMTSGGFGFFGN